MTILIIGGDSQVGCALDKYINDNKIITTRRQEIKSQMQYFDLNYPQGIENIKLNSCTAAVVCAGITSISICEKNPEETFKINVINTIQLLNYLNRKKIFTVFISSSAIFGESEKVADEYTLPSPSTQYGRQKSYVEDYIQSSDELKGGVAILRLTKVLSRSNGFIFENMNKLKTGNKIFAYSNLFLSPISMPYVMKCIVKLVDMKIPGIFNISNKNELSYFDLFIEIAKKLKIDTSLVCASSVFSDAKNPLFRPARPSLGMSNASIYLGIMPEPLEEVINYLAKSE